MANALPHKPEQLQEAESLADEARFVGKKVFSAPTITLAPVLINGLIDKKDAVPMSEVAGDVRLLRTDGRFNRALTADLDISEEIIADRMLHAMSKGYASEMEFQVTQIKGLSYEVTDQDHADMRDYPIQGHTCAEISNYMHRGLRYEIEGLLASPLVGDIQADSLPTFIGSSMQRFGDRCAGAVDEAYFAGVQMALRGVVKAMGAV